MDIFNLNGRTALVTGGGTGLGRQFAIMLAQAGATVVICARRADKLAHTAAQIAATGGQAYCVAMDVTSGASVRAAFDEAAAHGVPDIIVNNAGVTHDRMLLDVQEEDWDAVVDTNLKGPWLVACEGARRLIAHDPRDDPAGFERQGDVPPVGRGWLDGQRLSRGRMSGRERLEVITAGRHGLEGERTVLGAAVGFPLRQLDLRVVDRDVGRAAGGLQIAVLRADTRVVEPGRDAVGAEDLALLVLGAPAYVVASFPAGMSLADTYGISGGDHSPWASPLFATSLAALLLGIALAAMLRPAVDGSAA